MLTCGARHAVGAPVMNSTSAVRRSSITMLLVAFRADARPGRTLRVCADPDNVRESHRPRARGRRAHPARDGGHAFAQRHAATGQGASVTAPRVSVRDPAGPQATTIVALWEVFLWIPIAVFVLVIAFFAVTTSRAVWRRRHGDGDPLAEDPASERRMIRGVVIVGSRHRWRSPSTPTRRSCSRRGSRISAHRRRRRAMPRPRAMSDRLAMVHDASRHVGAAAADRGRGSRHRVLARKRQLDRVPGREDPTRDRRPDPDVVRPNTETDTAHTAGLAGTRRR